MSIGQTLTSADIPNLTYSHDGNDQFFGNPPDDSFDIRVIDDGGGTGIPDQTTATINLGITPNNDDPVLTNNNGIAFDTASQGLSQVLTAADLQVDDADSPTSQLSYTLTTVPDPTIGAIQLFTGGSFQTLGVGTTFTQEDINPGRVRYLFNASAPGGATFNDSFNFEVRDGEIREYPSQRDGGIYPDETSTVLSINTFNITVTVPPSGPDGPGGTVNPDITANNPPTLDINAGIVGLDEAGSTIITNTMLSVSDTDNAPNELVYRITQVPTSGSIIVNGVPIGQFGSFTQQDIDDGLVTFQHAGNEDFIDGFSFTVSDGANVTAEETFSIDVTPLNDAPTASANGTPFLPEGDMVTIDNSFLSISDVDGTGEKSGTGFATPNNLTFTVTDLPDNGILEVDQGSGFVTVTTGTIITQAQLDNGNLRYVHDGSENFSDSFGIQANDNTGEPNNLSNIATVNIDIASLNDDPSALENVSLEVAEGGTETIQGSGATGSDPRLVFQDPDNTTIQRQFTITTAAANGTLMLNGSALSVGSVFTQDDLDNNRITYEHDGSENYTDSFDFTVSDGGGTSVPGSYSISVTPANDAPELTVPGPQTFDSDSPLAFSTATGNPITIADVDLDQLDPGETNVIQVILDLQEPGGATYTASTLAVSTNPNVTITGSNNTPGGTLTLEGPIADVQAVLDSLTVQVPADEDRTLNLEVTVDDNPSGVPNGGNGGVDPDPLPPGYSHTVTESIAIQASNDNDAPDITAPDTSVNPVEVNEDAVLNFTGGNTISISDVDAFDSISNTVTLSVNNGILNLGSTSGLNVTGDGTGLITLEGNITDINNALAGLSYEGNAEFNGSDALTVTVNDQGNTGLNGGSSDPQTATQVVDLSVIPVNDAPELVTPTATQTISDANPLVFSGANAITIDDVLTSATMVRTTLQLR